MECESGILTLFGQQRIQNTQCPLCLVSSSSYAHGDLDKVIIHKCGLASSGCVSPLELISQGAEFYATAHEVIERNFAAKAVAPHDDVQGLRTQIKTHSGECLLQLVALHRPAAVSVVGHEGRLPAVQNVTQLLELIETHSAGVVPIQHVDHQFARLQAEGFVCARDAGLCEALLQLVR